jgi:hypothetical protein
MILISAVIGLLSGLMKLYTFLRASFTLVSSLTK